MFPVEESEESRKKGARRRDAGCPVSIAARSIAALPAGPGFDLTVGSISATNRFAEQGVALLRVPSEITPGEHDVVVVIEENPPARRMPILAGFPRHDVQVDLPTGFTFRRGELYDDSGRGP